MPMTEPPENATLSALFMPPARAALAVRTFALVATRIPKKPAPIPDVPVPAEPDVERPYWTPYFVFLGVGAACAAAGYGLAAACSNPTWFMLGFTVLLLSLLFLIRGVVCLKR